MRTNKHFLAMIKRLSKLALPILLLAFWILGSMILNNKISFTVLEYPHGIESFKNFDSGTLLAGDVKQFEFKADENHLGIVNLRLADFIEDYQHDETLSFRIREKDNKNWYSSTSYKIGYLSSASPFPFGFPLIDESKDKEYVVEVNSSSINPRNPITISRKEPVILVSYQYPKREIIKNPKIFYHFIIQKISTSFTNIDFLKSSLLFALPFFFYLMWILFRKYYNKKASNIIFSFLLLLYFLGLFIDSFSFLITILFFLAWFISIHYLKVKENLTFIMGIVLTFIWVLSTYLGIADNLGTLNVWAYAFLSLGILVEIVKSFNEKV